MLFRKLPRRTGDIFALLQIRQKLYSNEVRCFLAGELGGDSLCLPEGDL